MKAYIFLADGFEEIEAITPIDILLRAQIEVIRVSISNTLTIIGAHNIIVQADNLFEENDFSDADILILPGGMPGTKNLDAHEGLKIAISKHAALGKPIAAICAAPLILGKMGLLKNMEAICYPGNEHLLEGAIISQQKVVKDGAIITAKGAGVAVQFALKIVETLKGKAESDRIENAIFF